MKKPRILLITHAYYNRGGVEEHIKSLSVLLKTEFDVAILSPCRPTDANRHYQLLLQNIPLALFPATPISWPVTPLRNKESELAIHAAVQLFRPDLFHIHHIHHWPLGVLEQIFSYKLPVIKSFHDYYTLTPHFTMEFAPEMDRSVTASEPADAAGPDFLTSKIYAERVFGTDISKYLLERRKYLTPMIEALSLRIAPSESTRREIESFYKFPVRVVPHGIRHEHNFPVIKRRKGLRFGYIGSLIRQKGWHVLLQAFMEAKEKNDTIELHLFGGGDLPTGKFPAGAYHHGRYRPLDLPEILSRFDVGIIPSIFKETFSYTLSELHNARKPVIASDIGALKERVIKEKNGILVPPENPGALSDAILWMADNFSSTKWDIEQVRSDDEMKSEYQDMYRNILQGTAGNI